MNVSLLCVVLLLSVCCTQLCFAAKRSKRKAKKTIVDDYSAEWGEWTARRCVALSGASKQMVGACTAVQELTEEALEQQAAVLAGAVAVMSASEMLRDSMRDEFYRRYGEEIIEDVVDWMLRKRIRDEERIKRRLTSQLSSWLLKVAAKDTNMQNVGKLSEEMAKNF